MYDITQFVHSVERGLSVTAILITLPHGQHMQKWPMINFNKPAQEVHQTDSGKPEQKRRACYLLL